MNYFAVANAEKLLVKIKSKF